MEKVRTVKPPRPASAPPGHPARGRSWCRGRSPGSRVWAAVRPSRDLDGSSDTKWTAARRLQLRGQLRHRLGAAPDSLLAPAPPREPRDHDGHTLDQSIGPVNIYKDIFMSACHSGANDLISPVHRLNAIACEWLTSEAPIPLDMVVTVSRITGSRAKREAGATPALPPQL